MQGQLTRIIECERSTQLFEREHLSETTKMDLKIDSYVQHKIQVLYVKDLTPTICYLQPRQICRYMLKYDNNKINAATSELKTT